MAGITLCQLKEIVTAEAQASAVGVCRVAPVDDTAEKIRREWLADRCHGDMTYLERYEDVRHDPALLLDGARSLVMAAFSFANPDAVETMRAAGSPLISEYALGRDYHTELRTRLKKAARGLTDRFGGRTRVCVDTAPLRERYWARMAGLGFIGTNNYLIIPGQGLHFVLGALLWTGEPDDGYDTPCTADCLRCGRCVRACPTGALSDSGRLDARRCLSYLTVESRSVLPDGINTGGRLFGCDTCRRVCPHEPALPLTTPIEGLKARQEIVSLTARDWATMTPERFETLFADSPLRRRGLPHLLSTLQSQPHQPK